MIETYKSDISFIRFSKNKTDYTFLPTGNIYEFSREHFVITQVPAGLTEEPVGNIYLRVIQEDGTRNVYPLRGQETSAAISGSWIRFEREVEGIVCSVTFLPVDVNSCDRENPSVWIWKVELEGKGKRCDVIYVQDIGVADRGALQSNVLYQSQYLGHHVAETEEGYTIASRHNMDQGGAHPMLQQGTLGVKTVAYSTDAFQLYGLESKRNKMPCGLRADRLPSEVYQYEMACIALQTEEIGLEGKCAFSFYGYFVTDCDDPGRQQERASRVKEIWHGLCNGQNSPEMQNKPEAPDCGKTQDKPDARNDRKMCENAEVYRLLGKSSELGKPFASKAFGEAEINEFFPERSLEEYQDGKLLSFFTCNHRHVVLEEKEVRMERPHGHILMTQMSDKKVDKELLAVTNYMYGVFASQLVVGNVDSNPLLDATRDTLNLHTRHGVRIWVKMDGKYRMLTMPAAYEMGLNFSRWYYVLPDDILTVTAYVAVENAFFLQAESRSGKEYEYLFTFSLALAVQELKAEYDPDRAGVRLWPDPVKPSNSYYPDLVYRMAFLESQGNFQGDGVLYEDGKSRDVSLMTASAHGNKVTLFAAGTLGEKPAVPERIYPLEDMEAEYLRFYSSFVGDMRLTAEETPELSDELARMNELLPWFLHDAMIHFAAPHGLEQSGGAAWGTRDVCQGPMELFLSTGHLKLARETLLEIFAHQNKDTGEWPQYFMYDRYPYAAGDCHGDVVFWPLKSMGDYIAASKDTQILSCQVPYRDGEEESIREHIERAVANIRGRMLPGTWLVNYAGGDWDDTLQPARPEWKEKLCSAWTEALAIQVIGNLALQLGDGDLSALADRMKDDFHRYLVKDGVIAGFALMEDTEHIQYLLHPLDQLTGLRLRLLPLTRSIIAEVADRELAEVNENLIQDQLTFPDGVRLMNRPAVYNGGVSVYFQRAEQAANVGREIGILYVHAHIRYLEAMARLGRGDKLWKGLLQVNPIQIASTVPNAALRQANAYFSSSDAAVKDRYEFSERFGELREGSLDAKGGWRIYSSGPGIYLCRVIRDLLGIRAGAEQAELNPALPPELNGLSLRITLWGRTRVIRYRIPAGSGKGYGVKKLCAAGEELEVLRESDCYREGGVKISKGQWIASGDEITLYTC